MNGTGSDGLDNLLEREAELERIARRLSELPGGRGGLMVIEGPAGIGKTEVLGAARRLAREQGAQVLHARCTELEAAFSYGAVRQLFEPPLAAANPTGREELLQGAAGGCASLLLLGRSHPGSTYDPEGIGLLHALWWLTSNLAALKPVVISVDDVQWADAGSLRFLLFLANRLEDLPTLVLLGVRSGEPLPSELSELIGNPEAESLTLRPLSDRATAQLVRARLSEKAHGSFCTTCHEVTEGNPFLLKELLRAVTDRAIQPDEAGATQVRELATSSVSRSVLRRLKRLGPRAVELARALAVWGGRAELRQAAAVAGIDEVVAGQIADDLAAIEILRPGRPLEFMHPLVRTAIYSDLPAAGRAGTHRKAAALLERESAPAEQVAAHLVFTDPAEDPRVVRALLRGATAALERGSPKEAKQCMERALREPPAPEDLGRVLCKLGVAEMRIDPKRAVSHLSQALEVSTDHYERGAICLELIHGHIQTGTVAEGDRTVRAVIAELMPLDRELALRLEAELIIALRQGEAASPVADRSLEEWRGRVTGSSPAERLILSQLAVRAAIVGASADEVADLAELALGEGLLLSEQSAESLAAYVPLYPLLCADRFGVVEVYLHKAMQDARGRGSPLAFALAATFKSNLHIATGDLGLAQSGSSEALGVMRTFGLRFLVTGCVDPGIESLIQAGKLDQADALLVENRLDGQIPDSVPGRILRACRGRLRMVQGRTAEGMEDLVGLMRTEDERGPSNLYLTPYRPWVALGFMQSGQPERARRIAEAEMSAARAWGSPRILTLTLTTAGRVLGGKEGLELHREAVEIAGGSQATLAEAHALAELGSALRRSGRRLDAIDLLRRALDLAHRCRADALSARARAELVVLGARPRRHALVGADALTPAERRVAELAAAGMTNRQIAQDLFVTTRTVEHHLTHAFQKLGIQSRAHLHGALK